MAGVTATATTLRQRKTAMTTAERKVCRFLCRLLGGGGGGGGVCLCV